MEQSQVCTAPSSWQVAARRFFGALIPLVLPRRATVAPGSLAAAGRLLAEGYGFIVVMNHFSHRDSFQVLGECLRIPGVVGRPALAPVAMHQRRPAVERLAGLVGLRLQHIVTAATVQRLGGTVRRGEGVARYLATAVACLAAGGVILLAPQGGRRPTLGKPRSRALGVLLGEAAEANVDRVALLFVGLGIRGVTDYSDRPIRGVNLGRIYEVRIGAPVPAATALAEAGGLDDIDAWGFERLRGLVPAAYRGDALADAPAAA